MIGRRCRRNALCYIAVCLAGPALIAPAAAVARTASPSRQATAAAARPYATLPHLGPAPQRCFQYGSSHNICNGASFPYPPNANYLYATYYGTVYISPHIVGVDQDITATAAPDNKGTPSWDRPPGPIVAGCRPKDATCTWKATTPSAYPPDAKAPGGGYGAYGMTFCGFFGCAESQDFYYVLPRKRAISGTVVANQTTATGHPTVVPISGAVIQIKGPQSGTAVTGASGFYDALVDPGQYDVSVASVGGAPADMHATVCDPGSFNKSACQLQVRGRDAEADFTPCTATGPASDRTARAAASGVASCPLDVKISIGPSLAGLGYDPVAEEGVARFFAGSYNGPCRSGCTDVTVTVRDKPNGALETDGKATINASVTPITGQAIPRYPRSGLISANPGEGYLCDATQVQTKTSCSTVGSHDLTNLPTDANGQVHLRYWAPGLVEAKTVTISAQATGCKCTAGGVRTGRDDKQFTVQLHRLRFEDGQLTPFEAGLLAKWTAPKGIGGILTDQADSSALDKAVDFLFGEVLEGGAGTAITVAQQAFSALSPDQRAEQEVAALVMDKFRTVEWGLGDSSDDGLYKYDPANDALPKSGFLDPFAGDSGTTGFGSGGLLWKYGQALARTESFLRANGAFLGKELIHLTVYEVSYCDQSNLDCGPGYASVYTPGAIRRGGIHPFLYFYFTAFREPLPDEHGLHYVFSGSFVAPYNANAWMQAQLGGP